MKRRIIVALCAVRRRRSRDRGGDVGATKKATASSITVWLQVDAQSGWPTVVAAANKAFEAAEPGRHGERPVPAVEHASAEVRRHARRREHARRDRDGQHGDDEVHGGRRVRRPDRRQVEVPELLDLAQGPRGLGDVRRQADGRPVLRGLPRRHLPHGPVQAGRDHEARRRASAQFVADGKKLDGGEQAPTRPSRRSTSPARTGTRRSAFVYDYGGQIATLDRTASGPATLDSPRAIAGLNAFKNTFLALSRASKSTDEANPFPTTPFSQGHAASFVGPGWQFGYALDPKAGNPKLKPVMGAFPMPSHVAGQDDAGASSAAPTSRSRRRARTRSLAEAVDRRLHRERAARPGS